MTGISRKLAWLAFLTALFMVDDVLIYFLLQHLLEFELHPVVLSAIAVVVTTLNVWLAVIVYRLFQRLPTTGAEGMIGKTGTALTAIKPEGQVNIQGEIWRAGSAVPIKRGEPVVVERVEGLKVFVRKPGP